MAVKKIGTLNKHQNPATNENEFDIENYMNVNWDKIKEVVDNNADELTTTQGKVTTLETDNKKNKQDISDIKSKQELQNDLLQRTQSALINITTPKSSNINVKDSSYLNAKIDVFGISEQETREGYNLFNNTKTISNVTYNSEEDKWVFNLPGKYDHIATKGTFFKNIKANTNYTLYLNILKNTANNIITFNPDKTIWNTSFSIQAGQTGIVISNIKTKEDLSSALYDLWFSHPNIITGEFEAQIMLVEGTFTSENIPDYEQYGASPSPEFPSKIENVTGDIDITVCNKNLANLEIVSDQFNVTTEKINANTFKITRTANTSSSYGQVEMNLDANKTYTVFVKISGENTTGAYITLWKGYNGNGTYSGNFTNYKTIQTTQDLLIIGLYPNQSNNLSGLETTFEIMIIEGNNINEDFVPHEEQLITFPLAQGQKLYDKDYPASDGIHHVRKQIELDGTENWQLTARDGYYAFWLMYNAIGMVDRYNKKICTHFPYYSQIFTEAPVNSICENSGSPNLIIFKVDFCTTIEEWKTYLAQQKANGTPVILEYELAEEVIEPYTSEQQEAYNKLQNVLSYYNVTNVFTDNALLEFKYIADTQTWVVNLVKNEVANTNKQLLEIAGGN